MGHKVSLEACDSLVGLFSCPKTTCIGNKNAAAIFWKGSILVLLNVEKLLAFQSKIKQLNHTPTPTLLLLRNESIQMCKKCAHFPKIRLKIRALLKKLDKLKECS